MYFVELERHGLWSRIATATSYEAAVLLANRYAQPWRIVPTKAGMERIADAVMSDLDVPPPQLCLTRI